MSITTIAPRQLHDQLAAGEPLDLIDVRTPAEFREAHASIARNVPLTELEPAQFAGRDAALPLYVMCRSGSRANQACQKLHAAGVANVVNVEGGIQAWEHAGLPVIRGQKTISLERQVRIVAGALVVAGAVLAIAVHPLWAALAAFVGAGLMFAGLTDTCGMAMLLARMPWNQIPKACSASSAPSKAPRCCG